MECFEESEILHVRGGILLKWIFPLSEEKNNNKKAFWFVKSQVEPCISVESCT